MCRNRDACFLTRSYDDVLCFPRLAGPSLTARDVAVSCARLKTRKNAHFGRFPGFRRQSRGRAAAGRHKKCFACAYRPVNDHTRPGDHVTGHHRPAVQPPLLLSTSWQTPESVFGQRMPQAGDRGLAPGALGLGEARIIFVFHTRRSHPRPADKGGVPNSCFRPTKVSRGGPRARGPAAGAARPRPAPAAHYLLTTNYSR